MSAEQLSFSRADLEKPEDLAAFTALSLDYFNWMNGEISRCCGFTIPDIVKMELDSYVLHTVNIGRGLKPEDGGVYFMRNADGKAAAMGGLRRLPDGAAEIVRIYTRPEWRGNGLGRRMVQALAGEARRLGYSVLRLDTAVFMTSAQKIYEAAGFMRRDAYAGAEPPKELQPYWLYLERPL